MKKRIGILSLVGLTAMLLTLMGVFSAMAAPAAAVDGTITLDKSWYTLGATAKVTIVDSDFSTITADKVFTTTITADAAGGGQTVVGPESNAAGTPAIAPLAGTCPAVAADCRTAKYVATLATVVVSNGTQGKFLVSTGAGGPAVGTVVAIVYNTGSIGSVSVKLSSSQDTTGITLTATETAIQSGKFEVTFNLVSTASNAATSPALLLASDGGTIAAAFTDTPTASGVSAARSTTARVEIGKPIISNLVPVTATRTQSQQPAFSGTITDVGGSGVKIGTISLNLDGTPYTPTIVGNDGDTTVTFTFTPSSTLAEQTAAHTWRVTASDLAGNAGQSDAKPATSAFDDQELFVDKSAASMLSAITGKYWDTTKTTPSQSSNRTTSVAVTFSEAIDAASVSGSGFTVDGTPATSAAVFSGSTGDPTRVYLTLGSALAPNAKPVIALVGSVKDLAGNLLSSASNVTAADGIAPSFTVTLSAPLIKASTDLTIDITSNEPISGAPGISIFNPTSVTTDTTVTAVPTGATSWRGIFNRGTGTLTEGKNSVIITGSDLAGNAKTTGTQDTTSTSAIVFTLDTVAPTVTTVTSGGVAITGASADVANTNPFVVVNFNEAVVVTSMLFGSTLADVTSKAQLSSDSKSVSYAATGLTVGTSYSIRISVKDLIGNSTNDKSYSFKVVTRKTLDLQLKPGMNLVSVTSDPSDTGINAVMNLSAISSVVTYDPLNPSTSTGPWLSATRGADGKLSGNLASIDSKHAYWVNSTSFVVLKVNVPDPGFTVTPPSIVVKAGWNLVPVASVTVTGATVANLTAPVAAPYAISADRYFSSLPNWITAYTFDPATNAWTKVTPKNFPADNVIVGNGYWLYTTTDGVLVP